tara:strand:- start:425 stop:610 length:186 start_codon:yes stop_codon:yes gene_type:complete
MINFINRARLYRVRVDHLLRQLEHKGDGTNMLTTFISFTIFDGRKKEVELGDLEKEMQIMV